MKKYISYFILVLLFGSLIKWLYDDFLLLIEYGNIHISYVLLIGFSLFYIFIGFLFNKARNIYMRSIDHNHYLREIDYDYSPLFISFILYGGVSYTSINKMIPKDVLATILLMVNENWVKLERRDIDGGYQYFLVRNYYFGNNEEIKFLYDLFFKGNDEISLEMIGLLFHKYEANSKLSSIAFKKMSESGLLLKRVASLKTFMGFSLFAIFIWSFIFGSHDNLFQIASSFVILSFSIVYIVKNVWFFSDKGLLIIKDYIMYNNFLRDFGNFKNKSIEEVLLRDKHMVYAVFFGLCDDVMDDLFPNYSLKYKKR